MHDPISALPDDVLVYILSLLKIREAAMTSCLSTRWRHLWKKVPVLSIDKHIFPAEAIPGSGARNELKNPHSRDVIVRKFIEKGNQLLQHHDGMGISKFKVNFILDSTHASDVDRWFEFAARSAIKELKVNVRNMGPARRYEFPLQCFAGVKRSPLLKFSLSNCSLTTPPNFDGFLSLTYINLRNVRIADTDISNVISCCGPLEHLRLRYCRKLVNVSISHARLQRLDVCNSENLQSITIHADNLASFEYIGLKVDIKYENTPKLTKVAILSPKESGSPNLGLLSMLPNLKALLLNFYSPLENSSIRKHRQKFAGLRHIVLLLMTSWNENIRSVVDLIEAAPSVETFRLEAYSDVQLPKELDVEWPTKCSLKRLRTVTLGGFSGESELMELAFFLLENAPALKKLCIDTHRCHFRGSSKLRRGEEEDAIRCYYARGMALTNLAPRVPSTVKFEIR